MKNDAVAARVHHSTLRRRCQWPTHHHYELPATLDALCRDDVVFAKVLLSPARPVVPAILPVFELTGRRAEGLATARGANLQLIAALCRLGAAAAAGGPGPVAAELQAYRSL